MDYGIIDCDQHVIEPPDLWEKYLPSTAELYGFTEA